jgi:hypothetical protein
MTETPNKNDKPPFTHIAWIRKTEFVSKGLRAWRWINEGDARVEADGSVNVYLHSLPIGGFNGLIHLAKIGTNPPDVMPAPQRPDAAGGDAQDSED